MESLTGALAVPLQINGSIELPSDRQGCRAQVFTVERLQMRADSLPEKLVPVADRIPAKHLFRFRTIEIGSHGEAFQITETVPAIIAFSR